MRPSTACMQQSRAAIVPNHVFRRSTASLRHAQTGDRADLCPCELILVSGTPARTIKIAPRLDGSVFDEHHSMRSAANSRRRAYWSILRCTRNPVHRVVANVVLGATMILRHRAEISCTILLAVPGALQRCPPLAVLALRRVVRLAAHPATTAKLHTLFLRGA
jgi:hypothetical protein